MCTASQLVYDNFLDQPKELTSNGDSNGDEEKDESALEIDERKTDTADDHHHTPKLTAYEIDESKDDEDGDDADDSTDSPPV